MVTEGLVKQVAVLLEHLSTSFPSANKADLCHWVAAKHSIGSLPAAVMERLCVQINTCDTARACSWLPSDKLWWDVVLSLWQ